MYLKQSCPQGLTQQDLKDLLGDDYDNFRKWMTGQTESICDGRTYHHDMVHTEDCGHEEGEDFTWKCKYTGTGYYEDTPCKDNPHGVVTYFSDVEKYLLGLPVIDW